MNKTIYNLWKKVGINYFWGDLYDSRFYIAQLISKKNIECILDIGCGAGVLLHFAKAQSKIGIDLSLESLIAAKKIHEDKMELIQGDARFLPFKDDFFTDILAMHIISAFDKSKSDRIKCMSEIQRISSNTCEIVITGANRRSRHFKNIYSDEYNEMYLHYSEVVDFFKKSFKVDVIGYGSFSRKIMYPLKLVYKIPEIIVDMLKIEDVIFYFLKSKRFLKDGRSYIVTCKR